jgi:hypothetical protein
MKITFSPSSHSEVRKNDLRISLIMHDLDSAYTLPTPKNSLCTWVAVYRRSKRHDA